MPVTCIAPISQRLEASPWQELPEMATDYRFDRAGIEAGLRVLEIFHLHYADRFCRARNVQGAMARTNAALAVTRLRVDIVGAMR